MSVSLFVSLKINLGQHSYPIHIQDYLLDQPNFLDLIPAANYICVVTSESVSKLYLPKLQIFFELGHKNNNKKIISVILPDGESAKNWDSLNQIFTALLSAAMPRNTLLIALGGGVIGDITGLAASLYQRGIPYIQIPTTLLAQVDSSIGGKTAINHSLGKNMIGSFYQPKMVLIDVQTLKTLPDREYYAGLAEVIKYGLIADANFFEFLEKNKEKILARDPEILIQIIQRSCEIKGHIVEIDEKETGIRAYLNLGHTYGHAIETLTDYKVFLHGEAVSMGMVLAIEKSIEIFKLDPVVLTRTRDLLKFFKLPAEIPENLLDCLAPEKMQIAMGRDKKNLEGKIRLILLKNLGEAAVY